MTMKIFTAGTIVMKFFNMLSLVLGLFSLLMVLSAPVATVARAEVIEVDKQRIFEFPSTGEDVGLTFLKVAGVKNPDFSDLLKRTEAYKSVSVEKREDVLKDNIARVSAKYAALNPAAEGLLIRLAIKVNYVDEGQDGLSTLEIQYPSKGMTYFPFIYAGMPIAVIPDSIDMFNKIILSPDEKNIVKATIDATSDATLILDLKPVSADARTPLVLDGEKQFPLLCQIGYIGIHNRSGGQVWAWATKKSLTEQRRDRMIEDIKPKQGETKF